MQVMVLYFHGCPHWQTAEARVQEAIERLGRSDVAVVRRQVLSDEQAESLSFGGSPTILVDGRDPFPSPHTPAGLSCRVYITDAGLAGAPTVEQLMGVLGGR